MIVGNIAPRLSEPGSGIHITASQVSGFGAARPTSDAGFAQWGERSACSTLWRPSSPPRH